MDFKVIGSDFKFSEVRGVERASKIKFFREIESDASAYAKGVIEQNKVIKNRIFQFLLIQLNME